MRIAWEDVDNTEVPGDFLVNGYLVHIDWMQIKIWRNEPEALFNCQWRPETVGHAACFFVRERID